MSIVKWFMGGVVAIGAFAGYKMVTAQASPPTVKPFTASGPVQVGDVVTVSLVSIEGSDSETSLEGDPSASTRIQQSITPAVQATLDVLMAKAQSGATGDFQVTAIGLIAPGGSAKGQPITLGILVNPSVAPARLPFGFLSASIQKITRNGVPVT